MAREDEGERITSFLNEKNGVPMEPDFGGPGDGQLSRIPGEPTLMGPLRRGGKLFLLIMREFSSKNKKQKKKKKPEFGQVKRGSLNPS